MPGNLEEAGGRVERREASGARITDPDLEMVRWVARLGIVQGRQVAERFVKQRYGDLHRVRLLVS